MAELFGRVGRLRPRARRLDAPARRRPSATTAAGASSPGSCRSRPASRSALVRQERPQAVLCELGDGAVNMGAWHESLNLAAVWRLPVVFLVMNNEYGMGTSVERASAVTELYRRAAAYDLPSERVDGDDLLAVAQAAATMLAARPRGAPGRRPRARHLPLPRPLGRRRRARLPHARRDRRAHPARPDLPRARAARRRRAWATPSSTRCSGTRRASASPPRSRRRSRARRRRSSTLASGMYAPGSAAQFARMLPGAPFGERELVFAGGLGE